MVWGLVLIMPPAAGAQREAPADGPGTVRWFGLLTEDAAAARTFYVDLFGWQTERTSSGGYIALHDGQPFAGITQIGRSVPEIDESTWLVGVVVSDLRDSVATARRLGAQVLRDVSRTEGFAQWAVIEDPQGAQDPPDGSRAAAGGRSGPRKLGLGRVVDHRPGGRLSFLLPGHRLGNC